MSETKAKVARRDNTFKASYSASGRDFIKASRKGVKYAFCEHCACDFSISHGGMNDGKVHISTVKHKSYAELNKGLASSKALMNVWAKPQNPTNDATIKAEVLFQGFVLQHNLPFAVNDSFNKMVSKMFPDSEIAKRYSCGHTKASHLIQCIGQESISEVKKQLITESRENVKWYALSTDGGSDIDDKYFPILITYEHADGFIRTRFLDMPTINYADAKNIADTVERCLSNARLSLTNCAAFVSDNASVMIGKHKGVLKLLQNKRTGGEIYGVGCACHLAHLAAKQGAKALSFDPQDFLVDIFYHFDKSVKRKELLREDIAFCNETIRKMLKHVSTRWLSMSRTLERVLAIWDGLRCYFLTHFDEDIDEPPSSKRQKMDKTQKSFPMARERRLVKIFKNPVYKLYILFLHAVMPRFENFNTLLQREDPMIHRLHPAMMKLYRDLLGCLMQPSVIVENGRNLLNIAITEQLQKPDEDLFIGFSATQLTRKENLAGSSEVIKFYSEVRGFFEKSLNYLKQKFPLNDPVLKAAAVFDPKVRLTSTSSMIEILIENFPDIIPSNKDDQLLMEFTSYQTSLDLPIFSEEERIDKFWHDVAELTEPATGKPQFKLLSQLAKYILLIPHSNAFCEGIFSMVRKNTTEVRSSLGKSVEGHSSDGAYADSTGIRNNLCAVLASKINVFKSSPCTKWSPSGDLLQMAKSATYKSLTSRKEART